MTSRSIIIVLALGALIFGVGQPPSLEPPLGLATPLSGVAGPISIASKLTPELLTQLGGMIVFIEVMQQLVVKRLLESKKGASWYGLAIIGSSFGLAYVGGCLGSFAMRTLSSLKLVELLFTAIEATFVATFGYEAVKHLLSSYAGLRSFLNDR